jgi:hypothetical protein
MFQSLAKMPFNKLNEKEQIISSKNLFIDAEMHFQKLEESLWFTFTEIEYKSNVHFNKIVNKEIKNDYYSLSYDIYYDQNNETNSELLTKKSWSFYKPDAPSLAYHFKNTKAKHISVYFNEKWLKDYLLQEQFIKDSKIIEFFESNLKYLIWHDSMIEKNEVVNKIIEIVNHKGENGVASVLKLKATVIDFIFQFASIYNKEQILENYSEKRKIEHLKILKVENYLVNNLTSSFQGIDFYAQKFALSPAKLKTDFKQSVGSSIFQYFQKKQMLLAKGVYFVTGTIENNLINQKVVVQ